MGGVCCDAVFGALISMIKTVAEDGERWPVATDMISICGNPFLR
jgi:hypothetical protein